MKHLLTVIFLILFSTLRGQNIIRSMQLNYSNNRAQIFVAKYFYKTDSTFTMCFPDTMEMKVVNNQWFIQNTKKEYLPFFDKNRLFDTLTFSYPILFQKKRVDTNFNSYFGEEIVRDGIKFHFISMYSTDSSKHKLYYEFTPLVGFIRIGAFDYSNDMFLKTVDIFDNQNHLIETLDLKTYLAKMK
jgi:hypothetical protein